MYEFQANLSLLMQTITLYIPVYWQWIFTLLIVLTAVIYAAFKISKVFIKPVQKSMACHGCAYDCTTCPSNQVIQHRHTVSCKNI